MNQPAEKLILHDTGEDSTVTIDGREHRLFYSLDLQGTGSVAVTDLMAALSRVGLDQSDARLALTMSQLKAYSLDAVLTYPAFCDLIRPNILLIEQALQGNMVIPDFEAFTQEIECIYQRVKSNTRGKVAEYIPQLARVDPDQFGVAICTVDGQRFAIGDAATEFSVQSCSKPVTYCAALEEHGADEVHRYIGREPSGRMFNELALNADGKPHNPMINSGAIMASSLIGHGLSPADRFNHVISIWQALCGGSRPNFNNAVYQSERQTADRNFALGYYMREQGGFPPGVELLEVLEFFFQSCSLEVTADMMSVLAATLANGGVCPVTGNRVFRTANVQHCLSLMSSCGLYDFSGEFAFSVGLPAKTGVGGGMLVVIPNVMGLGIWSPRLDSHGNTARGVEFCRELVRIFNVHNYDNLTGISAKHNIRADHIRSKAAKAAALIWAASKGDTGAIHRLVVRGHDQDVADYDGRTPLHLAAAEGRVKVVEYFVDNGAELNPIDRWGGTPLDDALHHEHEEISQILQANGACSNHATARENPRTENEIHSHTPNESDEIVEVIYAASEGDLQAIQRLVARGAALGGADYDRRTPLHLAAAGGHERVVQYFIDQGVPLAPQDRWGGTPVDDALRHGHQHIAELLVKAAEAMST